MLTTCFDLSLLKQACSTDSQHITARIQGILRHQGLPDSVHGIQVSADVRLAKTLARVMILDTQYDLNARKKHRQLVTRRF